MTPTQQNHLIIGISGNSGAGKTTLVKALADFLKASALYWDDFDPISKAPDDYVDWYARGQNYDEWDYKHLSKLLAKLKQGENVIHSLSVEHLTSTKYILFDAPLGKFHQQTGQYIDYWIHIAVPLDVSLSRRLIRDFKDAFSRTNELIAELEYYLAHARPLFFDNEYLAKADLVIDGMLPTSSQIAQIEKFLLEKK